MMTRTFLCPPTFYDVTYSINPFMDPSVKVDRVLAWRQWSRFVDALERVAWISCSSKPRDGCPDMGFLGDAGLVLGDRSLCSRFRHRERQPESDHYTRAVRPPRLSRDHPPELPCSRGSAISRLGATAPSSDTASARIALI